MVLLMDLSGVFVLFSCFPVKQLFELGASFLGGTLFRVLLPVDGAC